MKQIYFIDSENVNDAWLSILDFAKDEDQILIFYTQKSPHMSYRGLRKLKESKKDVTFIECYEGQNALDFQLVGELGCQLTGNNDCEFIIVSNDTGFDSVIRYWKDRNYPVKRYNAQYCKNLHKSLISQITAAEVKRIPQKKVDLLEQKESEADTLAAELHVETEGPVDYAISQETEPVSEKLPEEDVPARETILEETPAQEETPQEEALEEAPAVEDTLSESFDPENTVPDLPYNWDEILRIVGCIGKDNLGAIHTALQLFYGEESTDIYYAVKDKLPSLKKKTWAKQDKYRKYLSVVFAHSQYEGDIPEDFSAFIYNDGNKRSNLNSLRYALNHKYGKDKGMKLYSVVKPHMKTLNVI